MQRATVHGGELEYEVIGTGEPALMIRPVLADGFLPLLRRPELAERYQLVRYHKRGWAGSTRTPGPVSVEQHAADAGALLAHLGIPSAHVVGHSSGAAVATQLALDAPERVRTLVLLELSLLSLPEGQTFLAQAGPIFDAYGSGDHEGAIEHFLVAVSGLDWPTCLALLEERIPGAI